MLTSRMWDNLAFAAVNEFVTPISAPPVYEPQFKQVVVLVWVSLTVFVCFNAATFGHGDRQSSVKLHLLTNPDLELVNGGSDKPGGRCETAPHASPGPFSTPNLCHFCHLFQHAQCNELI